MLGKLIKEERTARGLTQDEVAADLHIAKSTYSNWENGNADPSINQLRNLCKYFCVSSDYLLGLTDENPIITSGLPSELVIATRGLVHVLLKLWKKIK